MSCKKGAFIYIGHNDLWDVTANMSEVCKNTEIEPKLTPGEELQGRTSNNSKEARADFRTQGFWGQGQQTFFDFFRFLIPTPVVITTSPCRVPCYEWTGKEMNLQWKNPLNRTWYIFSPLAFSVNVSMGKECQKFYLHLAQLISEKRDLRQLISSKIGAKKKILLWIFNVKSALRGFKENKNSMQKSSRIWNWCWCISHCCRNIN